MCNKAGYDDSANPRNLQQHQEILCAAAHTNPEKIDEGERDNRGYRENRGRDANIGQRLEISGEKHRCRGYAAGKRNEQRRPAVGERNYRMKGVAQVNVNAASIGPARSQFAQHEGAEQCNNASRDPRAEHQGR